MQAAAKRQAGDRSELLRQLDPQQRQLLTLFQQVEFVTNAQIAALFGYSAVTTRKLCDELVATGFLELATSDRQQLRYKLAALYQGLLE